MNTARVVALADAVAVVVCGCLLGPPILTSATSSAAQALEVRDQQQVGDDMKAMELFAFSTNGYYPIPGELDLNDATLTVPAMQKNDTGNILSILVFNGLVTPKQLVSPAEVNTQVQVDTAYEYSNPSRAADPANALWDPGLAGTPIDTSSARRQSGVGNQSYAHILPFGNRRAEWSISSTTLRPILANRGPQYAANDSAPYPATGHWVPVIGPLGTQSNTLRIHGPSNSWEGNVAFNDLHVAYWAAPTATQVTYTRYSSPHDVLDNIFVNESDESPHADSGGSVTSGMNIFLRPIAGTVGSTPSVVALWRD